MNPLGESLVGFVARTGAPEPDDGEAALETLRDLDADRILDAIDDLVGVARAPDAAAADRAEALEMLYAFAATSEVRLGALPPATFDPEPDPDRRPAMLRGAIANAVEVDYDVLAAALEEGTPAEKRGGARYYAHCSKTGGDGEFIRRQVSGNQRVCGPLLELLDDEAASVRRAAARTIRTHVQNDASSHVPAPLLSATDRLLDATDDPDARVRTEATIAALWLVVEHDRGEPADADAVVRSVCELGWSGDLAAYAAPVLRCNAEGLHDALSTSVAHDLLDVVLGTDDAAAIDRTIDAWVRFRSDATREYVAGLAERLRAEDGASRRGALSKLAALVGVLREAHDPLLSPEEDYAFVLAPAVAVLSASGEGLVEELGAAERETVAAILEDVEAITGSD